MGQDFAVASLANPGAALNAALHGMQGRHPAWAHRGPMRRAPSFGSIEQ